MTRARTVFLGSGSFAIPILARLAQHAAVDVVGVVSAPARRRGRGQRVELSPVAAWAAERDLPVLTPARLRSPEARRSVADLRPDLLVLADYGQIVPQELLDLPAHGALNLHPSLLPRHRGAAPVAAAILAGDAETGVTLMRMDAGLDTGPIIAQRAVRLAGHETAPELEDRLAQLAADLVAESLGAWLTGDLVARPQSPVGETMTRPLRRDDGLLDSGRPAAELERRVRAYQPWPGSFIDTPAGRFIVWSARVLPAERGAQPGTLVPTPAAAASERGLALVTSDGLLDLLEVQPAGKRRMSGAELLRGRPQLAGMRVAAGSTAGSGV